MTVTRHIANFAGSLSLEDVPQHVRDAAVLHLVDAIGVGLASSAGCEQKAWSNALQSGGGVASCLTGGRASAAEAAMVNGALIHALEYDDTHTTSVIHGSAVAAPAAMAAAEAANSTGADFLLSYIMIWEIMIRIGLAAPGVFQERGFQVTAVAGAIGAAAGTSRLYGLSVDGIQNAMGIAGSQASGLLTFVENGASVKALNPGWAAHTGLLAANLSASGMRGPPGILEGQLGVMQVFAGRDHDLADHVASLGDFWHLPDAAFKLFPCCHYIHPFLEATEQLMAQGLRAADVKCITAEVAPGQAPLVCEPWSRRQSPVSGYDGKWGLAYCIALLLETGRVDVSSFDAAPDAKVVARARQIHWTPMVDSGFPKVFPAKLAVETIDGQTRTAFVADVRGTRKRPIDPTQIEAKFLDNARRRLCRDTCGKLLQVLHQLSNAPDLSDLSAILQTSDGPKNHSKVPGDALEDTSQCIGSSL